LPQPSTNLTEDRTVEQLAPWRLDEEREFRRSALLNAPHLMDHLAPWPAADWLAAMTIRELAPPKDEPYRGEERRRPVMR
jgi:hypothetical protein